MKRIMHSSTEYYNYTLEDAVSSTVDYIVLDDADTNNMTNVTHQEIYDSRQFNVYQIGTPLIALIILTANLLVIFSVIRILRGHRIKEKCTYICMGNLAFSDALTAFMVGGGAIIPNDLRSQQMCYANLGLILTATMASLLFVVLMSLDRYLYIVHSMNYEDLITPRRSVVIAVCAWIVSFIFGFIPVTIWRTDHTDTCMFIHIATKECIVFLVVVGIFIPLIIVFISYAIVMWNAIAFLRRKKKRTEQNMAGMKYVKGQEEINTEKGVLGLSRAEWRAFGACVIVVIAFIITWMPYFIASLIYLNCSSKEQCKAISTALATTLAMLGLLNSLLNPMIYTWWQKNLWKDIKAVFACCSNITCCKTQSYNPEKRAKGMKKASTSDSKSTSVPSTSDTGEPERKSSVMIPMMDTQMETTQTKDTIAV